MGILSKIIGASVVAVALVGCAAPDPFEIKDLPKGEQLDIRNILAAHPNKKACVDYQAATNSCASIITSTVEGNIMTSREVGTLLLADGSGTQRIEVMTRSTLRGEQACVRAGDIDIVGRDEMSAFVRTSTRELINSFGGAVCATYYRAGDGYVVSKVGTNGKPFPPGDTRFQFILGEAALRAQ